MFRLIRLWGNRSVCFLVYVALYCFVPALLIGFFVYFFMPFLMGGSATPYLTRSVFVSILRVSLFVGSVGVLLTMHPAIRKFSVKCPSFFESMYMLVFLRIYIDCAYCLIQPGIFISDQYGRFHPPLYVYILAVVLVFFGEKHLFGFFAERISKKKWVNGVKGVCVQLIPLVIISQAVVASYGSLRYEAGIDRTDPANMPSLNVIFQSYLVQEVARKYTARQMGYILADCVLSGEVAHNRVTARKYSTITVSPIETGK